MSEHRGHNNNRTSLHLVLVTLQGFAWKPVEWEDTVAQAIKKIKNPTYGGIQVDLEGFEPSTSSVR
jgi:hypothetical protein